MKEDTTLELRRNIARQRRYKKAIVSELNIDTIMERLQEMSDECSDVRYFCGDSDDTLLDELIGSEDEAFEFKMMFSGLDNDVNKLLEDLQGCYDDYSYHVHGSSIQYFDDFFASIKAAASMGDQMLGWDTEEQDYFPLDFSTEVELAEQCAASRLKKLTKDQMIEAAQFNFRIAISYIGIKDRYENLKAAIDILRGENAGFLQQIKAIERLYEEAERDGFLEYRKETKEFEQLIAQLPDETWVQ